MYRIYCLIKFLLYFIKGNKIVCTTDSKVVLSHNSMKRTTIRLRNGSSLVIGKNVSFDNVNIDLNATTVVIGDNSVFQNVTIFGENSKCDIGEYNIFSNGEMPAKVPLLLRDSTLIIGHHNRFRCGKIWVRFGGCLNIGNYNNLNESSELRCDELVNINNYNQCSYGVKIWDTNTHCSYAPEVRRKITVESFPMFGKEHEHPRTKPINIGSDNWFGMNVILLKGTIIEDRTNVGLNTIIANKQIPSDSTVVTNVELKILDNKNK